MTKLDLKINTLLVNKAHPDWGIFRINGYECGFYSIQGDGGQSLLDPAEMKFWKVVKSSVLTPKKTKKCTCKR